jgi:hypothetical protein
MGTRNDLFNSKLNGNWPLPLSGGTPLNPRKTRFTLRHNKEEFPLTLRFFHSLHGITHFLLEKPQRKLQQAGVKVQQ